MKIAIFYNFLDNIGGSEIVVLTLARELKADIYTTNIDREKIEKMGFHDIKINSIGNVSEEFPSRYNSLFKLFKNLDLKGRYDFFIILGEWVIPAAVNNKPNIIYSHHLIKEAWDNFKIIRKLHPFGIWRLKFDIWASYYRIMTKKYFNHINQIISNSKNTRSKIKKYLNKDSIVLPPPINMSDFKYKKNGSFWLSVNRLFRQKRVEIQMKAFSELPNEKLIIVGSHEMNDESLEYKYNLEKIKPENVEIVRDLERKELIDLYSNCKGFITTANDEDFGMTAVEAMASGKPVIAPNEGGYKETIINGKTGLLIDNINGKKLADAIRIIGKNPKKYKKDCIKQAEKFDTTIFIKGIKNVIKKETGK